MRFPTIIGKFPCNKSASYVINSLIDILQHDLSLKAKISHASQFEIDFNVHPTLFLERNAFLPNVYVVVSPADSGSICRFEYTLKKGARILFAIYIGIALILESLLLLIVKYLSSPFLLLIPLGLLIFAAMMTFGGLYVSSMQIHNYFLHLFNISSKKLKIVFQSKQQRESNHKQF